MASFVPQFFRDSNLCPNDGIFGLYLTPPVPEKGVINGGGGGSGCAPMWGGGGQNVPFYYNRDVVPHKGEMFVEYHDVKPSVSVSVSVSPAAAATGVASPSEPGLAVDMPAPVLPDYLSGIGGTQGFGAVYDQPPDVYGDEYGGFSPELQQFYQTYGYGWGLQGNKVTATEESNEKLVGRYSVEQRKDRILRYLKKRNQRNFKKTIKYACRKTLADRRVRVRGRFARNSELSDEEIMQSKEINNNPLRQSKDQHIFSNSVQIKHDEEDEWLQEAMANLATYIGEDC